MCVCSCALMFVICSQVRNGCVLVSDVNVSVRCALQHSLTRLTERYQHLTITFKIHLRWGAVVWYFESLCLLKGVGCFYWRWDIANGHHWWVRTWVNKYSVSSFSYFIQLWLYRKLLLVQICGEDSKEEKSMSRLSLCLREVCAHPSNIRSGVFLFSWPLCVSSGWRLHSRFHTGGAGIDPASGLWV